MRFHLVAGSIVILSGVYFNINIVEWLVIVIAIALVVTAECVNTAIECTVDLITQEKHPLAMHAKDTAAGAVLITSIMAIVIGAIIFIPKLKGVFFGT